MVGEGLVLLAWWWWWWPGCGLVAGGGYCGDCGMVGLWCGLVCCVAGLGVVVVVVVYARNNVFWAFMGLVRTVGQTCRTCP